MSGHTKGKFFRDGAQGMPWTVHVRLLWKDLGPSGDKIVTAEDIDGNIHTRIANAELVCEAFNVAHETGRTPRQLADERAELVEVIENAMGFIPMMLDEAGFDEEDEDWVGHLRAVLAKVKGQVQ